MSPLHQSRIEKGGRACSQEMGIHIESSKSSAEADTEAGRGPLFRELEPLSKAPGNLRTTRPNFTISPHPMAPWSAQWKRFNGLKGQPPQSICRTSQTQGRGLGWYRGGRGISSRSTRAATVDGQKTVNQTGTNNNVYFIR